MRAPQGATSSSSARWYAAAGNRFALLDLRAAVALSEDEQRRLAREFCAAPRPELGGQRADGLLLLEPPGRGGDLRLVVRNADGGRPETCGNGLRCVGHHELSGGVREAIVVETDAGPRQVVALPDEGGARIEAQLCPADAPVRRERFARPLPSQGVLVDAGNPHIVFAVTDPASVALGEWAAAADADPRFPRGCNVEVAAPRAGEIVARVWERGVGETLSCGSGACAIALAQGYGAGPWRVRFTGGVLDVRSRAGWLWLGGPLTRYAAGARGPT